MRYLVLGLLFLLPAASASAQTITSSSESFPYPGVRVVEGRTSGPTTDFYAAYISLCNENVHVDASPYAGQRTAASWGSAAGVELAVNGDFYTGATRNHVYGDAVAGGSRWALNRTGVHSDYSGEWYHGRYGWIAFGDDFVEFTNSEAVKNQFSRYQSLEGWEPREVLPTVPPGTKALVSGFPQLMVDGKRVTCSSPTASDCFADRGDMKQRHPRTAMGLSQDRQTFMLVVVDGRSTRSAGMYGAELAKLMEDLGAHVAFNLDGGGSSQMWVRGRGTINRSSDGSPRPVMNHWGVFAGTGNGLPSLPGHCDNRWDGLIHELPGQTKRTVDIDGDGNGDTCVRTPEGLECSLFKDGAFSPVFAGPALEDSSGWGDPSNYATLRYGDIDGDGRADVCARSNTQFLCWKSTGDGFGDRVDGPAMADDEGFHRAMNYSTIRLADINGDGKDDVCARWDDGWRCHPSSGDAFGDAIQGPALSNESGWDDPSYYSTIRVGDIDGDGDDDLCARGAAGMFCWRSDGTSISDRIDGPEWSDAKGWDKYRYYATIRLADIDGDGRADLCARSSTGVTCHLSDGDSFGPALTGPALSDASGWADYSNFASLRFADVTGDGRLDACARGNDGVRCWPFEGDGFGASIGGPLGDATGWSNERFHRTIDFVDLDADGRADLCARAARGVVCFRSTGTGFEETLIEGPAWSDEAGFDASKYYGTVAFMGRVRPAPEVPDPGDDTGVTPGGDAGSDQPDLGPGGLDPDAEPSLPDGGTQNPYADAGADGGTMLIGSRGGCGCSATPSAAPRAGVLLIFGFVGLRATGRIRRRGR